MSTGSTQTPVDVAAQAVGPSPDQSTRNTQPMNIREAARWAERKDILVRSNPYTGQPDYLYAVYDTGNHMVDLIGGYDKCREYMARVCCSPVFDQYAQGLDGRWLRMESLEGVVSDMDESDGESQCVPDVSEQREWA